MRIGIWLDNDYNPEEGGGFSYYDKLIKTIDSHTFNNSIEIIFVTESQKKPNLQKQVLHLSYQISIYRKIRKLLFRIVPIFGNGLIKNELKKINQIKKNAFHKQLKANSIKFIYYLRQAECELHDFPFIATNWDIGHKSTYAFPEIIHNGEFERRSYFYEKILPKALLVFCESEAGKKELLKFTSIEETKIKIVPLFSGGSADLKISEKEQEQILKEHGLKKNNFFFYPSQYWAHKNHYGILQAFKLFLKKNPEYRLVFTGSDKGNKSYIKSVIENEKLTDKVNLLGFVSLEEINTFFLNCTSLIMASYFGPTNMPPIEALELNCPVICSDLEGHREILKESALYFNTMNIEDILRCMNEISDEETKNDLLKSLSEVKNNTVFNIQSAIDAIEKHLCNAIILRNTWE